MTILFFFIRYANNKNPHSFPTRRSSDLLFHVQVDVAAGGEQVGLHTDQQPVGVRGDHVRRMALHRVGPDRGAHLPQDRKSTRLNSSHLVISYAVFCLKKKIIEQMMPVYK